jgi:hypothetical protein
VFITVPVPVGDGSENLISFDLKFVNTTGSASFDASAFDGVAFGYTGITSGVFNSGSGLHNNYSTAFGMTPDLANASFATAIDTHFLANPPAILVVTAPSEGPLLGASLEVTDSVAPFDAFASTDFFAGLTGTFALPALPTLSLAQIVIKDPGGPLQALPFGTGEVSLDFFMSGTAGGDVIFFDIGVPEPATMGLLAIGGLGALIRRRR